MADVLFVLITVAFFALAALFVRACGSIIGEEEPPSATEPPSTDATGVGGAPERPMEPVR